MSLRVASSEVVAFQMDARQTGVLRLASSV
jgi:hypothetical protein